MIDHMKRIRDHFAESAQLKLRGCGSARTGYRAVRRESSRSACSPTGRSWPAATGGSAADAQHFAAGGCRALRARATRAARDLAALTTDTSLLTAVANDYSFEQVFAKQVRALGTKGDVLLAISTSGNPATSWPRSMPPTSVKCA